MTVPTRKCSLLGTPGFFPQHRVQKLLSNGGLFGLTPEVKEEGSFLQLSSEGLPLRQVFIGITEKELIIVKQEIVEITKDWEIDDLVVDLVLPLPVIRFFIIDDRAKRFTICTCQDLTFHFEMCQLDSYFEESWGKWRESLTEFSLESTKSSGYKPWRTFYVIDVAKNGGSDFEMERHIVEDSDLKTLYCSQHSLHSFNQVRSIGVQTISQKEDESRIQRICNTDVHTQANGKAGLLNRDTNRMLNTAYLSAAVPVDSGSETSDSSADDDEMDEYTTGQFEAKPCKRLSWLYGGFNLVPNIARNDLVKESRCKHKLRRSSSWSGNGARAWSDENKANRHSSYSFALKLMLKHRRTISARQSTQKLALDSGSDESDGDVDEELEHLKATQDHAAARSGKDLWGIAKHLALHKDKPGAIERSFGDFFVHTAKERRQNVPSSLLEFKPRDVAMALVAISKRILFAMTVWDIDQYSIISGKCVPESIEIALSFGNDVSKMVATQIIKCKELSDRLTAIKFFLQVCLDLLFEQHDFQSLISILRGLTSFPVYRLADTWASFFVQEPLSFRQFLCLGPILSSNMGFSSYTGRVMACLNRNVAFIPWLDHFLLHCTDRARYSRHRIKDVKQLLDNTVRIKRKEQDDQHINSLQKPQSSWTSLFSRSSTTQIMENKTIPKRIESLSKSTGKNNQKFKTVTEQGIVNKTESSVPKSIFVKQGKYANKQEKRSFRFWKKKKQRVRFAIEQDQPRDAANRTNDDLKHLAKTRIVPKVSDIKLGEDSSKTKNSEIKNDGNENILPLSMCVQQFCQAKSREILNDAMEEVADIILSGSLTSSSSLTSIDSESSSSYSAEVDTDSSDVGSDGDSLNNYVDEELAIHNITQQGTSDAGKTHIQQEQSNSKTGKSKSSKKKEKTETNREKNNIFQKLKKVVGWSKRADTDHINSLEREIHDIQAMMLGLKNYDDDTEDTIQSKTSLNKPDSRKVYQFATPAMPIENSTVRRMSYMPQCLTHRRQSLFGEAIKTHESEAEEDDHFLALKNSKLNSIRKRGSLSLDLLAQEADDIEDDRNKTHSKNSEGLRGSVTRLFRLTEENESNNSRNGQRKNYFIKTDYETKETYLENINEFDNCDTEGHVSSIVDSINNISKRKNLDRCKRMPKQYTSYESIPILDETSNANHNEYKANLYQDSNDDRNSTFQTASEVHPLTRSLSIERLVIDTQDSCALCGNKNCIYTNDLRNQLLEFQIDARKINGGPKQRVKECIHNLLKVNQFVSDWELLQISLSIE